MSGILSAENGLAGLFAASFVASTIFPLSSEAALFGFLKLHPEELVPALILATLGNTLGGLTSYAVGRLLPARVQQKLDPRALDRLRRYGSPLTFFAWLPLVGDALCVGAGWLRLSWAACTAFMVAGRLLRYWVVAQGALM
ncbi:MAG: DedA family protein [Proteobacteria bacterium]|nr:DedA family protein [Pseudomonadota bacterium]